MSVDSLHTELSDIRETLDVNFIGTFALTKALMPLLSRNGGRIVNVTVPSEISPYWHPLAYVASKAARSINPARRAYFTASWAVLMPSLRKMFLRWVVTVWMLEKRSAAISLVVLPWAMAFTISVSVWVRMSGFSSSCCWVMMASKAR